MSFYLWPISPVRLIETQIIIPGNGVLVQNKHKKACDTNGMFEKQRVDKKACDTNGMIEKQHVDKKKACDTNGM